MKTIFSKNARSSNIKVPNTKVGMFKVAFIYMLALLLLGLTFKAEKKKLVQHSKSRAVAITRK